MNLFRSRELRTLSIVTVFLTLKMMTAKEYHELGQIPHVSNLAHTACLGAANDICSVLAKLDCLLGHPRAVLALAALEEVVGVVLALKAVGRGWGWARAG